jgi:hypothetical protein
MKRFGLVVALMVVTGIASRASAQEGAGSNALVVGAKSLSFALPSGGNGYASGAAGLWYMVTDNINLGMNFGLGIDRQGAANTVTTWDVLLAPAMRYYLSTSGVVAPYIHGQANIRFYDDKSDKHVNLGVAGGIGVEWFPVRNFSVGGQTGLGMDIVRPDPGKPIKLATFTSALTAQIYWE